MKLIAATLALIATLMLAGCSNSGSSGRHRRQRRFERRTRQLCCGTGVGQRGRRIAQRKLTDLPFHYKERDAFLASRSFSVARVAGDS